MKSQSSNIAFWIGASSIADIYGITRKPIKISEHIAIYYWNDFEQDKNKVAGDFWKALNKIDEKYGRESIQRAGEEEFQLTE